jgi:signal transduction histidine kinase
MNEGRLQSLERRVAAFTAWLALMHDVTLAIGDASSWDGALRAVLRRICSAEQWQIAYVYLPDRDAPDTIVPVISCGGDDERFSDFHAVSQRQRYAGGDGLPGRVFSDGQPLWVEGQAALRAAAPYRADAVARAGLASAAALPIKAGREVIGVLELFSDRDREVSPELAIVMSDIVAQIGRVLERERTAAQTADLVWREQQGLLHTLHDSLGQTLTGLGMLSAALSRRLPGSDPGAIELAQQIARQAQAALEQVRQMTRGLFPIEVDAADLMAALRQLAETTHALYGMRVEVEGPMPFSLRDGAVATQLYRIAQEAVTNAVKHAQAGRISICIDREPGLTTLRIADDGLGIRNTAPNREGVGLGIMRYRATSIGGTLTVAPGTPSGTVVTCTLRGVPHVTTPYRG